MLLAVGLIGLKCVTCLPAEKQNLVAIQAKANETVQKGCFAYHMYTRDLTWTGGLTNQEVVSSLQDSRLTVLVHYYNGYKTTPPMYPVDAEFELAEFSFVDQCDGVIGYRNVGAPDIYLNRCYHKNYTKCQASSNITHEWSHSLGYGHPVEDSYERQHSVPYSINFAFKQCCLE